MSSCHWLSGMRNCCHSYGKFIFEVSKFVQQRVSVVEGHDSGDLVTSARRPRPTTRSTTLRVEGRKRTSKKTTTWMCQRLYLSIATVIPHHHNKRFVQTVSCHRKYYSHAITDNPYYSSQHLSISCCCWLQRLLPC